MDTEGSHNNGSHVYSSSLAAASSAALPPEAVRSVVRPRSRAKPADSWDRRSSARCRRGPRRRKAARRQPRRSGCGSHTCCRSLRARRRSRRVAWMRLCRPRVRPKSVALMASQTSPSLSPEKRMTCRIGPNTSPVSSSTRGSRRSPAQRRCHAVCPPGEAGRSALALRAHSGLVHFERGFRVLVDDGTDIGRIVEGVADLRLARRAEQHVEHVISDVFLQEQHAQRRAALAGTVEGRGERSSTTCSGRAEESTIMQFWPPVSAMSLMMGPSRAASRRLMSRRVSVPPVKATPPTGDRR